MVGNIEIEKQEFYCYKSTFLEDVNKDNTLASKQIFSGEINNKQFIDCMHDDYKNKLLHIMLSKRIKIMKDCDKLVLILRKNLMANLQIIKFS